MKNGRLFLVTKLIVMAAKLRIPKRGIVGAETWQDHLVNNRDEQNANNGNWFNSTMFAPLDQETFRWSVLLLNGMVEAAGSALIGLFTSLAVFAAIGSLGSGYLLNGLMIGVITGLAYYVSSGFVLSRQQKPSQPEDYPNEMPHYFFWTITLANVLVRRTGLVIAAFYWLCQLLGSVIAAALLVWFDVSSVFPNPMNAAPLNPISITTTVGICWATQILGPFFVCSVYLFKMYLGGTYEDEKERLTHQHKYVHVSLAIGAFTALVFQFGAFSIDGTQWLPGYFASWWIVGSQPVIQPTPPFWFFINWFGAIAAAIYYLILAFIYGSDALRVRTKPVRVIPDPRDVICRK